MGRDLIPGGLLAHEVAHDFYVENVMVLLEEELGDRLDSAAFDNLSELLRSDADVIADALRGLERKYPGIADETSADRAQTVPLAAMAQHRAFKAIQAAHRAGRGGTFAPESLTGRKLAFLVVMEAMAGIQEVFADLVAVVHTNHPSVMAFILNDPLGKLLRDFAVRDPLLQVAQSTSNWSKMLSSASRGVPHVLLAGMRQHLYQKFYLDYGTYPGADPRYDARVLQEVLESFVRSFVKVYITNPSPRYREAAATIALVYEVFAGDVKYLIEERANAVGREFYRKKIIPATASRTSSSAANRTEADECKEEIVTEAAGGSSQTQYREHRS